MNVVVKNEGRLRLEEGGLSLLGERVGRVARRAVERLHLERRRQPEVSLGGVEGAEAGRAAHHEVAREGERRSALVQRVHLESEVEGARPGVQEVTAGNGLADLKRCKIPETLPQILK